MKISKMMKPIMDSMLKLPTPMNINIWWNFGSMLGICLMIQIITGLFLTMHYCPNINMAFDSVIHIEQNVNYGSLIRHIHMNGASMFFICMYFHIGRGIFYSSYQFKMVWTIGVLILLISMGTAFLGYVLPWGQMSFWGATVITNLLSAIPYIGHSIVYWIWGGFSINNATLNRFYTLHFILPFIILLMVILHLFFLHKTGSNNPMGLNSNLYKINFHPFFTYKDIIGFMIMFIFFMILIFEYPYIFGDPDNFIKANPMVTPIHIKPEWYFLFAYAILRSIPNKLGGVIALFLSIIILLMLMLNKPLMHSNFSYPINQFMFWMFLISFIMLTWLGGKEIEYPFIQMSQIMTMIYFSYFFLIIFFSHFWDKMIFKS